MMLEALALGVLQGLLEWLPISSQGNLVLIMVVLLGIGEAQALNLSIYLHVGTLLSALIYFRRTIWVLLRALRSYRFDSSRSKENSLISFLLFTAILTGLVGYPIFRFVETTALVGEFFVAFVGVALITTGILQKTASRLGTRTGEDMNLADTLLLGVMQGFSAIPGVSRSGITTFGLLFRGFKAESALNLSFLMSIPAILVAELGLGLMTGFSAVNTLDVIIGCSASFVTGFISIHGMLKVVRKANFGIFCIAIGFLALLPMLSYL